MKVIFVIGGVISGVGKGIVTSSIGTILQHYGYTISPIKIDPYINCDAGTLRPTEHGEVWVTDDGGEIDQDLGNYERFLDIDVPKINNITTGQIYRDLIEKERKGKFLGQTVEVIPHVTDEIKRRILESGKGSDFVLVEIGGTAGDYQNLPFLFAARSLQIELGWENVANVFVTYLPVPDNIGEMKTKPTQQSIHMLNESGIFPDFVLCRAIQPIDDVRKKKIEMYSNIDFEHIISAPDIKTVYKVPLNLEKENLGKKILDRFSLKTKNVPNWDRWSNLVERIENPSKTVEVAIVGKYLDIGSHYLSDSYISISHALQHAGAELNCDIKIHWLDSKMFEDGDIKKLKMLEKYDGVIIPGGFGASGVEGKINVIKFIRENNIPFLGLCFGMQLAVIEYARNICGMNAHSTEINPEVEHPVVDMIQSQRDILEKNEYGGTMRLGVYAAVLKPSNVYKLYKDSGRLADDMEKMSGISNVIRKGIINEEEAILERHRHRYEINPKYVEKIEQAGLSFPGYHVLQDGTRLMEFVELPNHKFFIGTQAHPEFKSRFGKPAPLFIGFVKSCIR